VVEEILVNGEKIQLEQLKQLPPSLTNLEFRYTALSLTSPTRISFRYKLEGFDQEWVDAGQRREAIYTNVPPGRYRFRLAARNPDTDWVELSDLIEFSLHPPFFRSFFFIPLCATVLALGCLGVFRLRERQIKSQMQAVLAERTRIARELHDTLIQGFSGVTMQMQALAARLRTTNDRETLEEAIRDAGQCLREARRSVSGLRSNLNDESELASAIAQTARGLTDGTNVRLRLRLARSPQGLSADVEYNLVRIVQEAVSNAVKHSHCITVDVIMTCTPQLLSFTVTDDGIGFEISLRERHQHGHYGLTGMRERATQINATLHLESGHGRGTTVRLNLPISTRITSVASASPMASASKLLHSTEFPMESTT